MKMCSKMFEDCKNDCVDIGELCYEDHTDISYSDPNLVIAIQPKNVTFEIVNIWIL